MKRVTILLLAVTALVSCAPYPTTSSLELAARETVVAQSTRQALAVIARATSDALALQEQATRQAQAAEATNTAATVEATRQAWALNATMEAAAAVATRESQAATATATAIAATSTSEAVRAAAESTAVAATSQAIERQNQADAATWALTTFGAWALVILAVIVGVLVGKELLPIVIVRLRVIRRKADEAEPLVMMERDANGNERIGLPLRSFYAMLTAGQLPADPWQDRATARAQLPAVVSAARGGHRVVAQRPNQAAQGNGWEVEQHAVRWPSRVPLRGILQGQPSVHSLALGVTVNDDGHSEVVRGDISKMVHIAVGGSSGWGKSVFLQSLAFQLAQATEPLDLAMVDLEGVTFDLFKRCDRLRWPIAETEQEALAIFQALTEEMDARKERGDRDAQPVILMVDEATALLDDKSVEGALKTLALRARKWNIWCVLGGQDWKATSLDTAIRNQLATRVQFKAMSASQSRVLLQQGGAEELDVPGRALAVLPGRPVTKLQAPWISEEQLGAALAGGAGPMAELPIVVAQAAANGNGKKQQIIDLLNAEPRLSNSGIAQIVFGYQNAHVTEQVRAIRDRQTAAA
jgi:hypothetical protein